MNAIEVNNLSKIYRLYNSPKDRLREMISLTGRKFHHEFYALKDVSFSIGRGQTVGIIGKNGSGKSTLLKIICGVLQPSGGSVKVNGRISSLLELGSGFNPEFTGRENVYMNCALMGFSREKMERRFPDIEEFADIGEFIGQPVKSYSSGMLVRLAFACAINVDPDIMVIDEALAVGDIQFQQKCMFHLEQLRKDNTTILFVSHDIGAVKALCDTAVYLKQGSIMGMGKAGEVADNYVVECSFSSDQLLVPSEHRATSSFNKTSVSLYNDMAIEEFQKRKFINRSGSGDVRIKLVELTDSNGMPILMAEFGQTINLNILLEAITSCPRLTVAFYVKNRTRLDVIGTNSDHEKMPISDIRAGEGFLYQYSFESLLKQGVYTITVILANGSDAPVYYDWIEDAVSFEVLRSNIMRHALYSPPVTLNIDRTI